MIVRSLLHLLTPAHCAQRYSYIPLCLALQVLAPAGVRTESPGVRCIYLCHMICEGKCANLPGLCHKDLVS